MKSGWGKEKLSKTEWSGKASLHKKFKKTQILTNKNSAMMNEFCRIAGQILLGKIPAKM